MVTLPLYGKEQEVRYRSKVLMAHFLGGRLVRVVWCGVNSRVKVATGKKRIYY